MRSSMTASKNSCQSMRSAKTPTSGFLLGADVGVSWATSMIMEGSEKIMAAGTGGSANSGPAAVSAVIADASAELGAAVASATGGGFDTTTDPTARGLTVE